MHPNPTYRLNFEVFFINSSVVVEIGLALNAGFLMCYNSLVREIRVDFLDRGSQSEDGVV